MKLFTLILLATATLSAPVALAAQMSSSSISKESIGCTKDKGATPHFLAATTSTTAVQGKAAPRAN